MTIMKFALIECDERNEVERLKAFYRIFQMERVKYKFNFINTSVFLESLVS